MLRANTVHSVAATRDHSGNVCLSDRSTLAILLASDDETKINRRRSCRGADDEPPWTLHRQRGASPAARKTQEGHDNACSMAALACLSAATGKVGEIVVL